MGKSQTPALRIEQICSTTAALEWFGNEDVEPHCRGGWLGGTWGLLPWICLQPCCEIDGCSIPPPFTSHLSMQPTCPQVLLWDLTLGLEALRDPCQMHWHCFLWRCSIPSLPRSCTPQGKSPIAIQAKQPEGSPAAPAWISADPEMRIAWKTQV